MDVTRTNFWASAMKDVLYNQTNWKTGHSWAKQNVTMKEEIENTTLAEIISQAETGALKSTIFSNSNLRLPLIKMMAVGRGIGDNPEVNEAVKQIGHQAADCEPSNGDGCVTTVLLEGGAALASLVKYQFMKTAGSWKRLAHNETQRALKQLQQSRGEIMDFMTGRICGESAPELLKARRLSKWLYCDVLVWGIDVMLVPSSGPTMFVGPIWFEVGAYYNYITLKFPIKNSKRIEAVRVCICINWGFFFGEDAIFMVKVYFDVKKGLYELDSITDIDDVEPKSKVKRKQVKVEDVGLLVRANLDSVAYRDPLQSPQFNTDLQVLEMFQSFPHPEYRTLKTILRVSVKQTDSKVAPKVMYLELNPGMWNYKQLNTSFIQRTMAVAFIWKLPGLGSK